MGPLHLRVYPSSDSITRYPPYLGEHTFDVKLDLVEVRRDLSVFQYSVLVVRREDLSLRDHPDGSGWWVVRLSLNRCLGAGDSLLEGGGGSRCLGFTLGRCHGVFVRVLVVNVYGGGLDVRITFFVV